MTFSRQSTLVGGLALLAGLLTAAPATADAVSDFYDGKQIKLLIGYSAGGGYDTYARMLARHMGKHIPGNPTIVPQNMPGAGSLKLANYIYNVAPKDGTVFGTIGRGIPMDPMLGGKGAQFKADNFTWLGSLNNEVSICASWHTSKVKTVKDLKTTQLIVGGTGAGADTDTFPIVMTNMFGSKIKLISGYPGGNDVLLAMERGELDGRCGWSWSSVKSRRGAWLKEKKINILLQMSLHKHADMPDVPLVMDMAESDDDKKALELIFARQVMGRPYLAPPEVPADRAAALRKAFDATAADPAFIADMDKAKLELNPVTGAEVEGIIKRIYASPKHIVARASDAIKKTTNIAISEAVIPLVTEMGKISKVANKGREVSWAGSGKKKGKLAVSGSKTKVTIGGKEAKRGKLVAGMECSFSFKGSEATEIACK